MTTHDFIDEELDQEGAFQEHPTHHARTNVKPHS